jgi:hypothetical protein
MWDDVTCGGYDGLTPLGPNLNEGAESTLALITTMQYAAAGSAPSDRLAVSGLRSTG